MKIYQEPKPSPNSKVKPGFAPEILDLFSLFETFDPHKHFCLIFYHNRDDLFLVKFCTVDINRIPVNFQTHISLDIPTLYVSGLEDCKSLYCVL